MSNFISILSVLINHAPNKMVLLDAKSYIKWRNKQIFLMVEKCAELKKNGKLKSAYKPVVDLTGLSWQQIYKIHCQHKLQ